MKTFKMIDRRGLLATLSALAALMPERVALAVDTPMIEVFKLPTCNCCSPWIEHLAANGFEVETKDMIDLPTLKKIAGVPPHLEACHTSIIDSYTVEGHVPASAIKELLAERPAIYGLAVPGIPTGSPGMMGVRPEPYDVIAFGWGPDQRFMTVAETDPQ